MKSAYVLIGALALVSSWTGTEAVLGKMVKTTRKVAEKTVNATQKVTETVIGGTSKAITGMQDLVTQEFLAATNQLKQIDACSATDGSKVSCCAATFFNQSLCLNAEVSFSRFKIGLAYNDVDLISEEVTTSDMPPVCAAIPQMPVVQVCLKAYDLAVSDDGYKACFTVSGRLAVADIVSVDLDCIRLSSNGTLSFEEATSEDGSSSGLISLDAGSVNPLLNSSVNGFDFARSVIRG